MVKQLPYSDKETGAHFVTYRDSAEMLRDGLLHALKSRQTFEAVEALSWIQEQLPEAVWMRFHVRQGEELARTGTWEPPVPNTVLSALLDHEKRVIQSAADLRNAVIESLQRLQQELTAETPAIDDLWDESTKGKFRPKNEAHLSNYVKRHLSRELPTTILGREVQIESSYGARAESTDIHVDAVARPASGKEQRVSVIVETKGCWNRNLWSDINDQLFRRYLQHGTNQGIYLVGWYNCESWDPLDYRRARAPNMSSSAAWEKLRRLASVLPKHHKHVEAFVLNCALPLPHPGKQ